MSVKIVATNRKARFNYDIKEKYEAGIELKGTEVKSIRNGKINITDGYESIESMVQQVHISPYEQANKFNVDSMRVRKLLLHKSEISYLLGQTMQKGFSLIPLSVYFKNGKVKVEIGLCQGKKNYDKRHDIAKREADIKIKRAIKEFNNR